MVWEMAWWKKPPSNSRTDQAACLTFRGPQNPFTLPSGHVAFFVASNILQHTRVPPKNLRPNQFPKFQKAIWMEKITSGNVISWQITYYDCMVYIWQLGKLWYNYQVNSNIRVKHLRNVCCFEVRLWWHALAADGSSCWGAATWDPT